MSISAPFLEGTLTLGADGILRFNRRAGARSQRSRDLCMSVRSLADTNALEPRDPSSRGLVSMDFSASSDHPSLSFDLQFEWESRETVQRFVEALVSASAAARAEADTVASHDPTDTRVAPWSVGDARVTLLPGVVHVEDELTHLGIRRSGSAVVALVDVGDAGLVRVALCDFDDGQSDVRALEVPDDQGAFGPLLHRHRIGVYEEPRLGRFMELTTLIGPDSGALVAARAGIEDLNQLLDGDAQALLRSIGATRVEGRRGMLGAGHRDYLAVAFPRDRAAVALSAYVLCRVLPIARTASSGGFRSPEPAVDLLSEGVAAKLLARWVLMNSDTVPLAVAGAARQLLPGHSESLGNVVQSWLDSLNRVERSVAELRLVCARPDSQTAVGRQLGLTQTRVSAMERSLIAELAGASEDEFAPIAWSAHSLRVRLGPRARLSAASTEVVVDDLLCDIADEERGGVLRLLFRLAGYRLTKAGWALTHGEQPLELVDLQVLGDESNSIDRGVLIQWAEGRGMTPGQLDEFIERHDLLELDGRFFLPGIPDRPLTPAGFSAAGSYRAENETTEASWDDLLGF